MSIVQKLVTEDSFVNGVLVPAGHMASFDTALLNGKEPHIHDADGMPTAVVEMSAIGPSGPNPVAPQQISPDTVQGPGGGYFRPGAMIVGEATKDADVRLRDRMKEGDTSEGDMAKLLEEANKETARLRAELAARSNGVAPAATTANDDDDLVAGNVSDIVATLGEKTDEELDALRSAELDREKPRKGVTDAIKAERAKRSA